MSVFCGTRLLLAFGFRGFQCNRLHQRNIASLGLASLFQVTTRRDKCFNTSIAPLNRCGIFKSEQTITVQLFSTGLLSCSENQLRKSPTPVTEHRKRTFIVDSLPEEVTVEQLFDYLKSFEEVETIKLVLLEAGKREKGTFGALVTFKSVKDINTLLGSPHHYGKSAINIRKIDKSKYTETRDWCHIVFTSGCSKNTSKSDLETYFGQFGDVIIVGMILQDNVFTGCATVAFRDTKSAALVAKGEWHTIGEKENVRVRLLGIVNE